MCLAAAARRNTAALRQAMQISLRNLICALIITAVHPALSVADQIILHSGETFSSSEVWEAQDKIRFNLNGLGGQCEKRGCPRHHPQARMDQK